MISQSRFFTNVLGAPQPNTRYSWGGVNQATRQVFLKVWERDIRDNGGQPKIRVWQAGITHTSHGHPERRRHLSLIETGHSGWGVLCLGSAGREKESAKVDSFDTDRVLALSTLTIDNNEYFLNIDGSAEVGQIATGPDADHVIDRNDSAAVGLVSRHVPETTTRTAVVETRIGQGIFRAAVLRQWGGACCVTEVTTPDALRAGHIKPWAESSHAERLDPANGLPLVATLDALFNRGLITFKRNGDLRISKRLEAPERDRLGLAGLKLRCPVSDAAQSYLNHHRTQRFQG